MTDSIREIRRAPLMTGRTFAAGRIKRAGMSLIVAALAATAFNVSTAMARHQWNDHHWEFPTDGSLTINVINCQVEPPLGSSLYGPDAFNHFSEPNFDWRDVINAPGIIDIVDDGACPEGLSTTQDPVASFDSRITAYDATDELNHPATINAFNGNYGNTGWVGVAIVELVQSSGDNHIVYGEVHLNDYYPANFSIYNDALVMRKVQCQEAGHVFGLDHIKKDTSCMYSSTIFLGSAYRPDNHDGEMINTITHSHDAAPPPPDGGGGSFCDKNPDHRRCQAAAGVFRGKATWAEAYESRDDMFEGADLVVSARVLNGSLFERMAGAPGRALPVSQAVLQVQETFKGNVAGVIRIEHVRGLGLEIEDDPGYVNGDDYLMFLRQIGARTFRVVNPQGRIPQ